jgi:2-polyprenyl-3-methyl-5-hydroxy-6-metoxy-1,4-benzoquinol methylase
MDIRTYRYLPHQALARANARHPWSHNDYFHGWILRNLPVGRDLAVDIGCGKGLLAGKLAERFRHVSGIDADEGMAAVASARATR